MTITHNIPTETEAQLSPKSNAAVKILVIGEEADVMATIKNLHRRGFADISVWTAPQSCNHAADKIGQMLPNHFSGQTVSVLTKNVG